jgi:hypothetical protein
VWACRDLDEWNPAVVNPTKVKAGWYLEKDLSYRMSTSPFSRQSCFFFLQVDAVRFPTNIPIPPNAEAQASDVGLEDAEAEVWRSRKLFSARCMYAGVVLVRN